MKQIARWTVNTLLILLVVLALFALLLPSLFSTRLAIVYSASMEPALPAGSLAVMTPIDQDTIMETVEVGDIIVFNPPWQSEITVSHRVTQVLSDSFVTKGDASEDYDPFTIPKQSVLGKVSWHIPYVGYPLVEIKNFASTIWGFCLLIVLPAMVVLGSAIIDVNFMYSPGKRRARLAKKRKEYMKKRGYSSRQLRRVR